MRKLTLLLAALSGSAFAVPAASLFPGEVGDSWTYQVTDPFGNASSETMSVIDDSGAYWRKWDDSIFGSQTWLAPYRDSVYQWQGHSEQVLRTDTGIGVGFHVAADAMCLGDATFTLVDDNASIDTPAGTFYGCRVYSVSSQCADAGLTGFALCPGIGLVEYSSGHIAGAVVAKLAHATIGNSVYPKPHGITVQVQANRSAYTSAAMKVRLELINNSTEVIDMTFQSAQKVDVVLKKNGQQVYSWGAHIRWMMFVNTVQIVPGQPLSYDVTLTAADWTGDLDGEYELEVFTVGDLQFSGSTTVSFDIP